MAWICSCGKSNGDDDKKCAQCAKWKFQALIDAKKTTGTQQTQSVIPKVFPKKKVVEAPLVVERPREVERFKNLRQPKLIEIPKVVDQPKIVEIPQIVERVERVDVVPRRTVRDEAPGMKIADVERELGFREGSLEYPAGVLGISLSENVKSSDLKRIASFLEQHSVYSVKALTAIRELNPNTPRKPQTTPLCINYVWLGTSQLGALEKFNIYSWRAMGCIVTIYTFHFTPNTTHTVESLGLEEGDAVVVDLPALLGADDDVDDDNDPRTHLRTARTLLKTWFKAVPKNGEKPQREHIYNMVDLTKSYLGGTRLGIVLDLKVGPSKHLSHYKSCFEERFISYSRGGKAAIVENQCMGTMQITNELRLKYAKSFDLEIKKNLEGLNNHNGSWFNLITGFHGRAFQATNAGIDVVKEAPSKKINLVQLDVFEIGAKNCGPFRVFKKASDQTNQAPNAGGTTKNQVKFLCQDVWKHELKNSGGDGDFLAKVQKVMQQLPSD